MSNERWRDLPGTNVRLRETDFVALHGPMTEDTLHLIGNEDRSALPAHRYPIECVHEFRRIGYGTGEGGGAIDP